MLRLRHLLVGAATIAASITLLGVIHYRRAGGRDGPREGTRPELAVGFLPVT